MPLPDPATLTPEALHWSGAYAVRAYEAGPNGRATAPALCNYLQDAAGRHAHALGLAIDHLRPAGMTWFLSRLHVRIDRYPAYWENLTVETWPSGHEGPFAYRDLLVRDAGGREIARALTYWLIVDLERRRPVRLPPFLTGLVPPRSGHTLDAPFPDMKLDRLDGDPAGRFKVRYNDLDMNAHVNNVRYLEWALEGAPLAVRSRYEPTEIAIQFRAETEAGDTVAVHPSPLPSDDGTAIFRIHLLRESDARPVASLHTCWRPLDA